MYKSASETTLKTSSTPNGTDNTDYSYQETEMREAEAQALRWLEQGHDFILETWKLFQMDLEYNAGMLQIDLEELEKAHHRTGHGADGIEWAYGVLSSTRTDEAATPAVMIFLRTCPTTDTGPGAVWKIPEEIHSRDLLPYCAGLAKWAAISWARGKLFDQWDEEEEAEQAAAEQKAKADAYGAACLAKMQEENRAALAAFQADAAQKEAQETFMAVTGRPGMAEVAGWQAHDAVARHKMTVAEAVQQAITTLAMWTWATPEAKAKEAGRAARVEEKGAAERKAQEEQEQEEQESINKSVSWISSPKTGTCCTLSPTSCQSNCPGYSVTVWEMMRGPAPVPEEEHDPVLERLMAEARAIREAPLSAFAADAGFGEDGEEIQTPPVPARHYQADALEQFEDAAAWDRF